MSVALADIAALVVWAAIMWVAGHLAMLYARRKRLEEAWLALFAYAARDDSAVDAVGLDAVYVAFKLMGLPLDEKLKSLPADLQSEVVEMAERLIVVGADMERRGILHRPVPTFERQSRTQTIKAPRSLFMLTQLGVAMVLKRRAKMYGAQKGESNGQEKG